MLYPCKWANRGIKFVANSMPSIYIRPIGSIKFEVGKRIFMKMSNKISLIAGVAGLATVGTGYAAWTFSKDVDGIKSTGNVKITEETEVGMLKADKDSFYLIIDQKFLGWATTDTAVSSDLDKITLKYEGAESGAAATATGWLIDETVTFTCSCDATALSSYINFAGTDDYVETKDYKGTTLTLDYTLPTVSWVDGMKPENETEYDVMVAAIGSATVNFTFKAEVNECTH